MLFTLQCVYIIMRKKTIYERRYEKTNDRVKTSHFHIFVYLNSADSIVWNQGNDFWKKSINLRCYDVINIAFALWFIHATSMTSTTSTSKQAMKWRFCSKWIVVTLILLIKKWTYALTFIWKHFEIYMNQKNSMFVCAWTIWFPYPC